MIWLASDKLALGGILVYKTTDLVYAGKNEWLADAAIRFARADGNFELIDKFIYIPKRQPRQSVRKPTTSAKDHAYFLIFKKVDNVEKMSSRVKSLISTHGILEK